METGLALWASTNPTLSGSNIGAAEGDHHLGTVEGPGLYLLVGPKAHGKSTHLELLRKLQDHDAVYTDVVTDGQTEARFDLAPCRAVFRQSPLGDPRPPEIVGADDLPPIASLPDAVRALISGGDMKGEEPRSRARLAALLEYCPVDSTAERLERLAGALEGRSWSLTGSPMSQLDDAWDELLDGLAKSPRKPMRYQSAPEIMAQVEGARDRDGSLLGDHKTLVDLLNATGLSGEKVTAAQVGVVKEIEGRRAQVLADAARHLGMSEGDLLPLLNRSHDREWAATQAQEAQTELAMVSSARAVRVAVEKEREDMAAAHGEEPEIDDQLVEAAGDLHDKAVTEEAKADAALAHLAGTVADEEKRRNHEASEAVSSAWQDWDLFGNSIATACLTGEGSTFNFGADLSRYVEQAPKVLQALQDALAFEPADRTEETRIARERVAHAEEGRRQAKRRLDESMLREKDQTRALARWLLVDAKLREPVEGPTETDVTAATLALGVAVEAVSIAGHAEVYREVSAELTAALDLSAALDRAAKDYRAAAVDTWAYLGIELTDALDLPWLQVDGLQIFLGYAADGNLNTDREILEAARDRAREDLASAAYDEGPVARMLLQEIRKVPSVEWRDIDSKTRISECELREACLEVMLSRPAGLGGILIVPPTVFHSFDQEALHSFDEKVQAAGLVVFSERPRRAGDPEEVFLERVAGRPSEELLPDDERGEDS